MAAPDRPSGRRLLLEGLAVYLVLQALTAAFLSALRPPRETFFDDVLLGFFGPEKHGLAGLLRGGFLPTWPDNQYGGEPFLANLQQGVLYPGNLPFWVLSSTSMGLEVVVAGHIALAGLGIEEPLGPLARPDRPPAVELRRRDQTRVEVEAQTAADGLLVLADPWYPQWKVTVDGRPAQLLRVDHAFRGVRIPAGTHRVVFSYEDRALQVGLVVSAVSVLGLAGLWLWRRRGQVRR